MKTTTLPLLALSSALLLPSSALLAQNRPNASDRNRPAAEANRGAQDRLDGVAIASLNAEERSLRHYAGQTLLNTENAELGTIKDFIVHVPSGRLRYAVVSSGGVLGIGNDLRLVPADALREGETNQRQLTIDIQQGQFLQLPPLSDADYVADRFQISAAQQDELNRRFNANVARSAPARETTRAAAGTATVTTAPELESGLVRATTLRGKRLNADGREVGNIENLVLDLPSGTVAALVQASGAFTGTSGKYLVPLDRIAFEAATPNVLTTTLTRADFDRAQPSNFGMFSYPDANRPANSNGDRLTPTGR